MSSNSSTWGFAYVNAYDGAHSANSSLYRIWYSSNVSKPSLGGHYSDCLYPGQHQHIFVPTTDININGTLDMNIRAISCRDDSLVRATTFELFASGIDIFILFRNSTGGVKFWDFGFYSNQFANVGVFNAIYDGTKRSHKFNIGSSISSCQILDGSNFATCAYSSFLIPQTLSSGTLLTACDSITTTSCISSAITSDTTVAVGESLWAIAMSSGFTYFKTPYRASSSASLSVSTSNKSGMPVGTALSYFGIAMGGLVALCFVSCFFYRKKNGRTFLPPTWDSDGRAGDAQSSLPVETVRRQQNPALELHGINSFDLDTVGTDAGLTTSSAVASSTAGNNGNFNPKKYTGRAKYVPTDRRTRTTRATATAGAGAGVGNPGGSNQPANPPIAEDDDEESDLDGRGAGPIFARTSRNI